MGLFDWLLGPEPTEQVADAVAPAPPTANDIEAALASAEKMAVDGRAPAPVISRVRRVATIVRALLPRLANLGLQSSDSYNVVATATDYLPESLAAYLALPRDWADTRPVAGGKSSLLLLIDQLDLLATTMNRMYDAANRSDANALVAQGKFLDEKFGGHRAAVTVDEPRPVSTNPLDLES
ncbi:hypothetical protein [Propioniciclava tarda]|uniref:Uncharacterized protein n=1 Tax=Propioniciclava tarda TaxID=433330 RepID=A0A4Q9KPA4_PROTD|nr:hypothetical protein [Propioniciclava tarda]TBT96334.1 hypothetical protein ET996_01335 [Propioniciclava tarda]SMO35762.1 hypothetical protein SAMN06266982_101269 [Propioniciclava tarda]HOA89261.1 hypothetical protein [Propioniciclava tarda]HQA31397.1 hypothetical protein [Propioniciclava tarda]HQD61163.1 hypothetical protein [Propioniciclava tarda]